MMWSTGAVIKLALTAQEFGRNTEDLINSLVRGGIEHDQKLINGPDTLILESHVERYAAKLRRDREESAGR